MTDLERELLSQIKELEAHIAQANAVNEDQKRIIRAFENAALQSAVMHITASYSPVNALDTMQGKRTECPS